MSHTTEEGATTTWEISRDHVIGLSLPAGPEPCAMLPIRSYKGVAVIAEPTAEGTPHFVLELRHGNSAFSIALAEGRSADQIAALWRRWGRVLGLPLLAVDHLGQVHGALHQLGACFAETPSPRRRGSPLVGRRSSFARRRRMVPVAAAPVVVRGEREIIARG